MKPVLIGEVELCNLMVEVWLTDGGGGAAYWPVEKGGRKQPCIEVGCKMGWRKTVDAFLHECMEFCLVNDRLSWQPTARRLENGERFMFVMNHNQFSYVVSEVACAVADFLPTLYTAYKKAKK